MWIIPPKGGWEGSSKIKKWDKELGSEGEGGEVGRVLVYFVRCRLPMVKVVKGVKSRNEQG